METPEKEKTENQALRWVAIAICTVVFLGSAGMLLYNWMEGRQEAARLEDIKTQYVEVVGQPIVQEPQAEEVQSEETQAPESKTVMFGGIAYPDLTGIDVPGIEIDFAGLQEICSEVYAWITIPDTAVDYPIAQSATEPEYYLRRTLDGNKASAGTIFSQFYNTKDWLDPNTILYGHNMNDGTMFADVRKYEDEEFFKTHPYIYIFTPDYTLVYEVYVAYEFSDLHLMYVYDFKNPEIFQSYLDEVLSKSGPIDVVKEGASVTTADRLLTLSTCVSNSSDNRYLVQGKLVAVGENTPRAETEE